MSTELEKLVGRAIVRSAGWQGTDAGGLDDVACEEAGMPEVMAAALEDTRVVCPPEC